MSQKSSVKRTYSPEPVAALTKFLGTGVPKSVDDVADALRKKLGESVVKSVAKEHKGDPFVVVEASRIVEALRFLRDDERFLCTNLNVVSAVDYPAVAAPAPAEGAPAAAPVPARMEVVYVLFSYTHRFQLVVKVQLDRDQPVVPSITGLFRCANWYERECYDMMGIRFEGHPHHARILLPPDWIGHPLRKDYVFPEEYNGMKVPL